MSLKWYLFWWGFLTPIFSSLLMFWGLYIQSVPIYICSIVSGSLYAYLGPFLFLSWWLIPDKEWDKYKGFRNENEEMDS